MFRDPNWSSRLNQGADLRVRTGYLIPWLDPVAADTELPFVEFATLINSTRRVIQKGSVGRADGQGGRQLALRQDRAGGRQHEDGVGRPAHLRHSRRRQQAAAAEQDHLPDYCRLTSGLPRAVLSEILGNLPGMSACSAPPRTDGCPIARLPRRKPRHQARWRAISPR